MLPQAKATCCISSTLVVLEGIWNCDNYAMIRRCGISWRRALAHQEADENALLGEETVIFRLGAGRYGVSARLVREVQPLAGYTPLPGTPRFVLGLINLRGRLLAALDIRPLLGSPASPPSSSAALLIVSASGIEIGLLADEVIEVSRGA